MVTDRDADRMRKAEKEVGENIPDEMVGLDTEDVGDLDRPRTPGPSEAEKGTGEDADKSP